jgi:hypothetical protein
LKRFARLLSALLVALLAYAAVAESACAAEGIGAGGRTVMASAQDDGSQFPDGDIGCADSCVHGHHHLDTAAMADLKLVRPEPGSEPVVQVALMPPPHRPGSLERPPRI